MASSAVDASGAAPTKGIQSASSSFWLLGIDSVVSSKSSKVAPRCSMIKVHAASYLDVFLNISCCFVILRIFSSFGCRRIAP
jgi:hypothetical protein